MRILKRINNNAVLCEDADGRQLVAFGKGVGFSDASKPLPLSLVERTFYDADKRIIALIEEISPSIIQLASAIADEARQELPHDLTRNIDLSLADHIAFAIDRMTKHINLKMPVGLEIEQNYPIEYRIGTHALDRIKRTLDISLPADEAAGIAMVLINGACETAATAAQPSSRKQDEEMLDAIIREIERRFATKVNRGGFEYTRFATHMYYLFRRIRNGAIPDEGNENMYRALAGELPDETACVESICTRLESLWGRTVDDGERLFLLLHINRMLQNK